MRVKHSFVPLTRASVVAIATSSCTRAAEERTYASPGGGYRLTLRGQFGPTPYPFVLQKVEATVLKGGETPLHVGPVFEADWFDSSFDQRYSECYWADVHTFLMTARRGAQGPTDTLRVVNAAGQGLRYVLARTAEDTAQYAISPGSAAFKTSRGGPPRAVTNAAPRRRVVA